MLRPKLSRLELRILEALWTCGKASIRDIHGLFPEPRPAYTTVQTIVYRMEAKRAVRRVEKHGNADIFEPLVAQDVTRNRLLDEILSFFGGKAAPLMAQLAERGSPLMEAARRNDHLAGKAGSRQGRGCLARRKRTLDGERRSGISTVSTGGVAGT